MSASARLLGAFVLAFGLLTGLGQAQELTDAQRVSLEARIASFNEAMKASDMQAVMEVVPPKVLDHIAASVGITRDALIASTVEQAEAAMASVTIETFGMDLEATQFTALEDGTPYGLVPTETVIDTGDTGKFRSTTATLAFLEAETWYLVRIDDAQQVGILKQVYPGFAAVEFPAGTMEAVTE